MVNQVLAVTGKTLKEFLREKMVIFWTFAVPIFFLLVLPLMYGGIPSELVSSLKGGLTVTMVTFLVMTAGQSNLPGSIATDMERGLYLKMASMPVRPWKEGLGRILAVWIFSSIGGVLLLVSGISYGAKFNGSLNNILSALGFSLFTAITSVGVGLIIASLVSGESAATHSGVAITLLTYFLGGMTIPYSNLPAALQVFARLYPISSANASMITLLEGETFVGYNPLTMAQALLTLVSSLLIFTTGLVSYSKLCWKKG